MTLSRFLTDPTRIRTLTRLYEPEAVELDYGRRVLVEIVANPDADDRTARAITRWAASGFRHARLPSRHASLGQLLQARRGEAAERAATACFLLRLAGIPTRFVSEVAYTRLSPGRLLRAPIPGSLDGPVSAAHTWLEVSLDDRWVPVDPCMGIYGMGEWLDRRLADGPAAAPFPYCFPILLRALDEAGRRREDRAEHYLIRSIASLIPPDDLTCLEALAVWRVGVHHFGALLHPRPVFPALQVFSRWPQLRAMHDSLKVLVAVRDL